MELSWSRWFRCESSFGFLLVPEQPGIFALAEEVLQTTGPDSRRMLAVFEINEAENVAQTLSRLFAAGSAWQGRLTTTRCYVRYAVVPDARQRRQAAEALKNWLNSQMDAIAHVSEMRSERRIARAEHEGEAAERCGALGLMTQPIPMREQPREAATVAERAVDRVMANKPLFPAGF